MGYTGMCGPKGHAFGLKKGIDFDRFGLEEGIFFTLAWHCVLCLLGTIFSRINIGKVVALLKCLGKWKLILVICGDILELRTNITGLKWGSLRSEIGYGKS